MITLGDAVLYFEKSEAISDARTQIYGDISRARPVGRRPNKFEEQVIQFEEDRFWFSLERVMEDPLGLSALWYDEEPDYDDPT